MHRPAYYYNVNNESYKNTTLSNVLALHPDYRLWFQSLPLRNSQLCRVGFFYCVWSGEEFAFWIGDAFQSTILTGVATLRRRLHGPAESHSASRRLSEEAMTGEKITRRVFMTTTTLYGGSDVAQGLESRSSNLKTLAGKGGGKKRFSCKWILYPRLQDRLWFVLNLSTRDIYPFLKLSVQTFLKKITIYLAPTIESELEIFSCHKHTRFRFIFSSVTSTAASLHGEGVATGNNIACDKGTAIALLVEIHGILKVHRGSTCPYCHYITIN